MTAVKFWYWSQEISAIIFRQHLRANQHCNSFFDEKKEAEMESNNLFTVDKGLRLTVKSIFTQMQATVGFKIFREKSVVAMVKELRHHRGQATA